MAIDYGNDYATILPGGILQLDLSSIRVTGPMVPVIRVARIWLEDLKVILESTIERRRTAEIQSRLLAAALTVDHVLAVNNMTVSLGSDARLRVSGRLIVGGNKVYPLNVTIGNLGQALAQVA